MTDGTDIVDGEYVTDYKNKGDGPPRARCGCPTVFFVKDSIGNVWKARHEVGCTRIPVRRREAVLATRRSFDG